MSFLVTPLDPDISAVIGLCWLRQHNLLVDWVNNCIEFRASDNLAPPPTISNSQFDLPHASWATLATTFPALPSTTSALPPATLAHPVSLTTPANPAPLAILATPATLASSTPGAPQATLRAAQAVCICFVNAAAFRMLLKMGSTQTGILRLCPSPSETSDASLHGAQTETSANDLHHAELNSLRSQIPPKYHDYLDVFSKSKADRLPDHNSQFDHHINIEEGKTPPLGLIYNTSEVEAEALWEFLKENLDHGFICQSQSLCGGPVLFVKKKDGLLYLCVDWHSLNSITRKDQYPLPLIPNLLDCLCKSTIFTKIDLHST